MDDELTAAVWRIKYRLLWIKPEPGELRLEDGLVTFTSEDREVFCAPLMDVRASFPMVIFPIPSFGVGVKLTVHGETYRLAFVWWQYMGWGATPNYGGGGTILGSTWSIVSKDFKPARASVRQWRTALGQPAEGALQTRCLECGAEAAEAAQVCARCGAPATAP
jgi:hypothetical protein